MPPPSLYVNGGSWSWMAALAPSLRPPRARNGSRCPLYLSGERAKMVCLFIGIHYNSGTDGMSPLQAHLRVNSHPSNSLPRIYRGHFAFGKVFREPDTETTQTYLHTHAQTSYISSFSFSLRCSFSLPAPCFAGEEVRGEGEKGGVRGKGE